MAVVEFERKRLVRDISLPVSRRAHTSPKHTSRLKSTSSTTRFTYDHNALHYYARRIGLWRLARLC